jgi:enoyl-[acyl-carrier protein] reductase I
MARLHGKVVAIFGFASTRSIAWGVAQSVQKEGGTVVVGIQSSRFRPALERATVDWKIPPTIVECDTGSDAEVEKAFSDIASAHGKLDALIHSIAHASQRAMRGALLDCPRADFLAAHDASSYSLLTLCRSGAPLLRASTRGSVVAMSFLGSQRVVPQYSVMAAAKASLEAVARQLAFEMVRFGSPNSFYCIHSEWWTEH